MTRIFSILAAGLTFNLICEASFYSERPRIESLPAQILKSSSQDWISLKNAHVSGLAALLELYSDHQVYFLARDAEYFYDLVRILGEREADIRNRVHLINVSRDNKHDPHLKSYLEQEGISSESFRKGTKFIFVDTGFIGSIIDRIRALFPGHEQQIKGHLIVSNVSRYPSLRSFLIHLNPTLGSASSASLSGALLGYEYMARFTDRSDGFKKNRGKWDPYSSGLQDDGKVSRNEAIAYMQDLIAFGRNPATRASFMREREMWRRIKDLAEIGRKGELIAFLRDCIANLGPTGEAAARDFIRYNESYPSEVLGKLYASDLGISGEVTTKALHSGVAYSPNKAQIRKMIKEKKWSELGAIIDSQPIQIEFGSSQRAEANPFWEDIAIVLAEFPAKGALLGVVKAIASKDLPALKLLEYTFTQQEWAENEKAVEDLFSIVVSKSGQYGKWQELQNLMIDNYELPKEKWRKNVLVEYIKQVIDSNAYWLLEAKFPWNKFPSMLEKLILTQNGEEYTKKKMDIVVANRVKPKLLTIVISQLEERPSFDSLERLLKLPRSYFKKNPKLFKRLNALAVREIERYKQEIKAENAQRRIDRKGSQVQYSLSVRELEQVSQEVLREFKRTLAVALSAADPKGLLKNSCSSYIE